MNNERIKNWAHVAEIISGVAVLITLVFLVLEIRDYVTSHCEAGVKNSG